jgi:hypothetical protein
MSEIPDLKRSRGGFRLVALFCGSLYPVTALGGHPISLVPQNP